MELPLIHYDCKNFLGYKPCAPNKNYGVFCDGCSYYERDINVKCDFPPIPDASFPPERDGFLKILIIKLDASGDVLRTTSLLPSLKKNYPNSDISWITKRKSLSFLKNNPYINRLIPECDTEDFFFHNEVFDIAVNLDSGPESCSIMSKISSKYKFGYELVMGKPYPVNKLAFEWYLMGVNDMLKKSNKKTYHKIIHEICGLEYKGSAPLLEITGEIQKTANEIRRKYNLDSYNEFILVNLGGGDRWQYKKWTKEGYSGIVKMLAEDKSIATGIVAGRDDRNFYEEVSAMIPGKSNILRFGCLENADDFISLIYSADKILTSDSLGFHVSTALGKYTVCFTGPTSHNELDVFGKGKIIYSDKVNCLCCYLNKCDKTVNCMNTLDVNYVYRQLIPDN
ncbi:MAG: hypothetical protein N2510_00820 [Ignavibacteria bacterium]|nr:hypothetical protein [Ignavibacteria bacterium]